jgi:hypothetical protein
MIHKTHKSLDGTDSSAIYSDCMAYRYTLNRVWRSYSNKRLVFIMLNPSTATELKNDPTVNAVTGGRSWEAMSGFASSIFSPSERPIPPK